MHLLVPLGWAIIPNFLPYPQKLTRTSVFNKVTKLTQDPMELLRPLTLLGGVCLKWLVLRGIEHRLFRVVSRLMNRCINP